VLPEFRRNVLLFNLSRNNQQMSRHSTLFPVNSLLLFIFRLKWVELGGVWIIKQAVLGTQGCGRGCKTSTRPKGTVSRQLNKKALLRKIFCFTR
jgi:hypothetical protein